MAEGHPAVALPVLLAAQRAGLAPVVVAPGTDPVAAVALARQVGGAAVRLGAAAAELLVLPTSGTTSAPRAVLRPAASWDAALEPFSTVTGARPDDVAWAPGPASSTLTLWAVWHALSTGIPVMATGPWRGVPADGAAAQALAGVTTLHAVPAVLADVLGAREAGALPALRTAVVAGAALPADVRRRAGALGVRVVEYYGAAELSFVAVDADGTGLRPFPGCEVRVRAGRIEVRSPYVSAGYLPTGAEGPLHRDDDGWSGVGDLGRFTDGVLEVAGRSADEALLVGGHVVLLADVERVLGGVGGVLEALCWGEQHPRWGARPRAAVRTDVPLADRADLLLRLRAAARAQLPPPARPVRYAIVDDLPRTSGGKLDRRQAQERADRSWA